MKTIRKKSAGLKGAAWLLCLSMLMTAVEPLAVQAEETIDVSSVIASETTEQTASEEAAKFDIFEDRKCNNFIGGYSCYENLQLMQTEDVFSGRLKETDKDNLFEGLTSVLPEIFIDKIWNMIYERYKIYENL